MIYIVSGYMRCGTSMMMKALVEGGMDAVYSRERDQKLNDKWGDKSDVNGYRPNAEYFEIDGGKLFGDDFLERFDGKVVKCLMGGLYKLPPCKARIIFMRRPIEEIRKSHIAAFGKLNDFVGQQSFDKIMDKAVAIAKDRRSVISVDEIWYQDVLNNPLDSFQRLADNGWPIDPKRAATIPSHSQKRYKA